MVPRPRRLVRGGGAEQGEGGFDKAEVMANIKSFGVAGTVSYVITELVFWAVALPGGKCAPAHAAPQRIVGLGRALVPRQGRMSLPPDAPDRRARLRAGLADSCGRLEMVCVIDIHASRSGCA